MDVSGILQWEKKNPYMINAAGSAWPARRAVLCSAVSTALPTGMNPLGRPVYCKFGNSGRIAAVTPKQALLSRAAEKIPRCVAAFWQAN